MSKIRVMFATPFTTGGGACRNMFNVINQLDDNYSTMLTVTGTDTLPAEYNGLIDTITLGKPSVTGAFVPLAKTIKSFRPHYIFTTTLNTGLACAFAVKLLGLKTKTIARCTVTPSESYHNTLKNKLLRKALQLSGRLIDTVIAQTDFMRRDLISYYRLPKDKVITIRNIVDTEHIISQSHAGSAPELNPANFNILAVGALYSVKGFDILIDAVAPIIRQNQNVHLYIIGEERYETGYKSLLQSQIDNLGIQNNVHLPGSRSNPFPYYAAADLFVLSSRKEGYPNVVLEALTLGTPVIATDVVDFKDVIFNGINGYVVDKNSVGSLGDGIRNAMLISKDKCSHQAIDNYDFKKLFR